MNKKYQIEILNQDSTITKISNTIGISNEIYETLVEMSEVLPIPRDFLEILIMKLELKNRQSY